MSHHVRYRFTREFQSTLPHGERHKKTIYQWTSFCFNPRSRTGSDMAPMWAPIMTKVFQSTLPHGERPQSVWQPNTCPLFQSTLPHGERRQYKGHIRECICFNPRSRTGSDCGFDEPCDHYYVSIHAPARGATGDGSLAKCDQYCFNPRSRTGSDDLMMPELTRYLTFQSTLPHGERHPQTPLGASFARFNPRSRTGSDLGIFIRALKSWCFNPRSRTGSDNTSDESL